MTGLEIRPLGEGEEPPYALLELADPSAEAVSDYLARGICYVGMKDGEVVGEYVLLPTRPLTAELVNVAVAEEWHGYGYGKQLVLHAVAEARACGYRILELGTGDAGIGQMALYQKCGFEMTHMDMDFFRWYIPGPVFENSIELRHMVRMRMFL